MKKITEAEVLSMIKENPSITLLNVLSSEDFTREHIPHSVNIPVDTENFIEEVENKVSDKNAPIIVYCASFQCPASSDAATVLEQHGYTNVYDFKGGMEEWNEAGNNVAAGTK